MSTCVNWQLLANVSVIVYWREGSHWRWQKTHWSARYWYLVTWGVKQNTGAIPAIKAFLLCFYNNISKFYSQLSLRWWGLTWEGLDRWVFRSLLLCLEGSFYKNLSLLFWNLLFLIIIPQLCSDSWLEWGERKKLCWRCNMLLKLVTFCFHALTLSSGSQFVWLLLSSVITAPGH